VCVRRGCDGSFDRERRRAREENCEHEDHRSQASQGFRDDIKVHEQDAYNVGRKTILAKEASARPAED